MYRYIASSLLVMCLSFTGSYAADFQNGVTHISQAEMIEKLKNPNSVLIDIRRQDELDEGYIEGAVHVPITEVVKDISLLDKYLDKDLIFYCHVGVRVRYLTDFLQDIGHPSKNRLFHLKGDMQAWRAKGNKVIKKGK